jgi:hypothetical protein
VSQTTLLVLLSAAAVVSAALSFLAWAKLARPSGRAPDVGDETEPEAARSAGGTGERTDAETDDIAEERDDQDTAT